MPTASSFNVSASLFNAIAWSASVTVTLHDAVIPCNVLTVIVAVPIPFAVTLPFSSTVATEGFDDVHTKVLFAGFTVALSADVTPFCNTTKFLSNVIVTLLFFVYTELLSIN